MNALKIYPKFIRKSYENNLVNSGIESPEKYSSDIFSSLGLFWLSSRSSSSSSHS